MLSRTKITKLIDESEHTFLHCWDVLCCLRAREFDQNVIDEFVGFQVQVAQKLFDLDRVYRDLHQEKNRLIRKKHTLNSNWYRNRMGNLDKYQHAIKDTISVGKLLGDAFAWIFYSSDRQYLEAHLEHQAIFHTPPGIGGRGEMELMKESQFIRGYFLIYHQITNYLRLGDVSLVNMKRQRIEALGEIKTKRIGPEELEILLTIISPAEYFDDAVTNASVSDIKKPGEARQYPRAMKERLTKQLKGMARSFRLPEGDRHHDDVQGRFHFSELNELLIELSDSPIAYKKVGDGLLLVGLRDNRRSLATRLLGRSLGNYDEKLSDVSREALQIVDYENKELNSLIIFDWHRPSPENRHRAGMTPIYWWPIEAAQMKKIFFSQVTVVGLYNPAHLILKLRDIGLDAGYGPVPRSYEVRKKVGESTLEFEGLMYFIELIALQLYSEKDVIAMIDKFLCMVETKVNSGEIDGSTRIDLSVSQYV